MTLNLRLFSLRELMSYSSMAYELGRFRHGKKEGKVSHRGTVAEEDRQSIPSLTLPLCGKFCPICNGWNEFTGQKLLGCHKTLLEVEDSDGK